VLSFLWTSLPDGSKEYPNKRWYEYTGLTLEQGKGWGWKVVHASFRRKSTRPPKMRPGPERKRYPLRDCVCRLSLCVAWVTLTRGHDCLRFGPAVRRQRAADINLFLGELSFSITPNVTLIAFVRFNHRPLDSRHSTVRSAFSQSTFFASK
jgi:hypothetical protein